MYRLLLIMALALGIGSSCGSNSGADTSLSGKAVLNGTLLQPNGVDPVPGALIFIRGTSTTGALTSEPRMGNFGLTLTVGTDCDTAPTDTTILASTCTDSDGTFALTVDDCSELPTDSSVITIDFTKGSVLTGSFETTITCSGSSDTPSTNTISGSDSTIGTASVSNLKIAVCSGEYDQMENVLARMGFAPSDNDEDGIADLDGWDMSVTENFNYFRGHDDPDNANFPSCCSLLNGDTVAITDKEGTPVNDSDGNALSRKLSDYDIVFINCGSGCESGGLTGVIDDVLTNATSQTAVQDFVSNGGALYATDLSYDFVEQNFPGFIDFAAGGNGATAETAQDAQVGRTGSSSFEPLAATVNQTNLKNYLSSVAAANTECGTPTDGSLNDDGTVNLCDFLGAWGVMIGLEQSSTATNWIEGKAEFSGGDYTNANAETVTSGTTDIPLTVSFQNGMGSVLYTSYHTDNTITLTTDFLPQERILQFLVLDVLGQLQ